MHERAAGTPVSQRAALPPVIPTMGPDPTQPEDLHGPGHRPAGRDGLGEQGERGEQGHLIVVAKVRRA